MCPNGIKQQIQELENKISKWQGRLKVLNESFESLKDKFSISQVVISKQEKELKDLEKKLFECGNDRDKIQGELDKKVIELEKSDLTKEEFASQITQLLVKSDFTKTQEKLIEVWSNYAKSKDSFFELLEAKTKKDQEAVQRLDKTKQSLWIIICILSAVVISLSLSAYLLLQKKLLKKLKRKKIRFCGLEYCSFKPFFSF